MGLHESLVRDMVWTYRWYNAYNSRLGRAHLFKVPLVKKKWVFLGAYDRQTMTEVQITEWLRRQSETPVWTTANYFMQSDALIPIRQCHREQAAYDWEIQASWREVFTWPTRPRRGWCQTCWTRMTNLTTGDMMPVPANEQNINGPQFLAADRFNDWVRAASGFHENQAEGTYGI